MTTINPRSQCLGQERKIFCLTTYLETKSYKTLKKDAAHLYDNDLLLRQETKKKIACSIITIKKQQL